MANLISSLDGPTLQSLLTSLQQQQHQQVPTTQQVYPSANIGQGMDLASLLAGATRQQPPFVVPQAQQVAYQPQPIPQPLTQPMVPQQPNAPVVSDPNLLSLLAKGLGGQQPQGPAADPNLQNIMSQLTKWRQ